MLPPGRRRLSPLQTLLPLLVLLLLSTTASAASAVLGIDLGTEYLKAALVKPGIPLEIVLTKDSRRKEAATIAFKAGRTVVEDEIYPERFFGADAVALSARFPDNVYPNLKPLLGLSYDSELAQQYRERYPGLIMEGVRDKIAFQNSGLGKDEAPLTVEELLGMELHNIRNNAEAAAGKNQRITDTVITIPPFYTAAEKRAVEFAAELAGLNVLALVSDGLAVGINYATSRTFPSVSNGGKPEYHLIYDMGAGSATATVLKFQSKTLKEGRQNKTVQEVHVLGTAWDKTLGGDALNQLILDDMVAQFVETPKVKAQEVTPEQVKKHAKTMARLWKDAEKVRQVLSANSQTSASFEGLFFEDVNFKYKLSRADFEKMASEYASRVSVPLLKAVEDAQLSISDLDSIILHGGAIRTPFAQKELEAAVKDSKKVRTNVNADEAAVLGAAFKAAGISPSFRVKDIRAYDTAGFPVSYKYTAGGKERRQKVFTRASQIGTEKSVPLKVLEDVQFDFYQNVDGEDVAILEVKTTNLTDSVAQLKESHGCGPTNITTKFSMRLSPVDALPEIVQGTVSCEVEAPEKASVMDGVKGLFGFGSKKDEQEPLKDDETPEDVTDETTSSTTTTSTKTTSTKSAKASASSKAPSGPEIITIPVHFTSLPLGISAPPHPDVVTMMYNRIGSFDASDRSRSMRAEAFNTLEAFTYRARDYLVDEEFIAYTSEAIRQTLEEKLNEIGDWLYGDGIDASLNQMRAKLKDLTTLVEPALKRKEETFKRPKAIEDLKAQLETVKSMIRVIKEQMEKQAEESASASASSLEASSTAEASSSAAADDIDADPYASTASSASATPTPLSYITPYTEADLTSLTEAYDSVSGWLEEVLGEQAQLSLVDDPAVSVKDLEKRKQELQDEVSALLKRKIKAPPKPGSSKSSKTKKTKTSSTASSSSTTSSSSSATETASTKKQDSGKKDEL